MRESARQIQSLEVKPVQRLILSQQMQQSLHFLQLPVLELTAIVNEEAEQNPLLTLDPSEDFFTHISSKDFRTSSSMDREGEDICSIIENTCSRDPSLYEMLLDQAREAFDDPQELAAATILIGHLDKRGYLTSDLAELSFLYSISDSFLTAMLARIQTFHPSGVGARTLQECFLIQLRQQNKQTSLAFYLIEQAFEPFSQGNLTQASKIVKAPLSEIKKAVAEIHSLAFSPFQGQLEPSGASIPDILISSNEGSLYVEVNEHPLPLLRFNAEYIKWMRDPTIKEETHHYLKEKLSAGRSLFKNILERKKTLERIGEVLLAKQHLFFSMETDALAPLKMKEVAEELGLHESTIARAVSQKILACPRGLFPLRSFFSGAFITESGQAISTQWVKERITHILKHEAPILSDAAISKKLAEEGITCARRTITKYRKELKLGNSSVRKKKYTRSASSVIPPGENAKSL